MVCRDQRGGGHGRVLVDNACLDKALDGLHGRGIDYSAEGADRIWAVYDIATDGGVLHDGGSDHDDIVGRASELFDDEIDHLAEGGIFVLEELRDAEEEGRGFLSSPALAREEKQSKLCENLPDVSHHLHMHRLAITYHSAFPW